jgi:anaerobic selenocysteine-containing dehydrogenase
VEALKALAAGKGGPDPGLPALLKVAARPLLILGTALGDPRALKEAAKLAGRLKPWRDGRSPVVVLKPAGNSAAAWAMGLAGEKAKADGQVKAALVCLGEEAAGADLTLPKADFLAVVSPYLSPALLDKAHLILPKPTWLEAAGTYASADGRATRRTARVLEPPPGVRPTEEVLAGLAAQLGPAKPKPKEKRG